MEALNMIAGTYAVRDRLLESLNVGRVRLRSAFPDDRTEHSVIEISENVGKLLLMAFLSGSNIAVESVASFDQFSVIGSVASCAPRFSKIAVVCKKIERINGDNFIRRCMKSKHDVAFVAQDIAKSYGADLLVCPFPDINYRRIMNFCRTRSSYITALDRKLDQLLVRKSIEGINSIDMLLTPSGSGFVMHELRWLSRNETEHGIDINGEDLLEMDRIGTNNGLECIPEDTKYARRYSKSIGERPDTAWNMVLKSGNR
jgi:hypothetical protein